jgi:hypothetical protein
MKWLILLLAACGVAFAADATQQVFDLFTNIASALADDNISIFVEAVDPNMPHFYDFRAGLAALVGVANVTSSVEVISDTGDDTHRTEELDWLMHMANKTDSQTLEERHKSVKFRLERKGKKWKIVSIDPLDFFAPPKGG